MRTDCKHLGAATLARRHCIEGCGGTPIGTPSKVRLVVFNCALHGDCTVAKRAEDTAHCCRDCPDHSPPGTVEHRVASVMSVAPRIQSEPGKVRWACGVTTVSERRDTLLPRTLQSLREAGFPEPRLFVDGADEHWYRSQGWEHAITCRVPRIRTFGNWVLGLAELWIRNPECDRFVMFQDDLVAMPNLRVYLDQVEMDERCYWNLHSFPSNEALAPRLPGGRVKMGFHRSNQCGRSALALAFSREGAMRLLTSYHHIVERPMAAGNAAWKRLDGGVVDAFCKMGWVEMVHWPSLTQHAGDASTMGNRRYPKSGSYVHRDALEMLEQGG